MQLVIPMAGLGTRFTEAGYSTAKPLLPIHGQPMFLIVLANLLTARVGKIIIIARQEFELEETIEILRGQTGREIDLIEIDYLTGGPADTVEVARKSLDADLPVITANSDQYVDISLSPIYEQLLNPRIAGSILTMNDNDPKWSYVTKDSNGYVTQVREKEVISHFATVGIYGFKTAGLMWQGFDAMREAKGTVNGEYYVAPAYNYLIESGEKIATYDLGPVRAVMHGMGIPEDYEAFLRNPVSIKAAERAEKLFGAP